VGPRAGLDAVARKNKSCNYSFRELNPNRPSHSLVCTVSEPPQLTQNGDTRPISTIVSEEEKMVLVQSAQNKRACPSETTQLMSLKFYFGDPH